MCKKVKAQSREPRGPAHTRTLFIIYDSAKVTVQYVGELKEPVCSVCYMNARSLYNDIPALNFYVYLFVYTIKEFLFFYEYAHLCFLSDLSICCKLVIPTF